jgi:hypothetical protein
MERDLRNNETQETLIRPLPSCPGVLLLAPMGMNDSTQARPNSEDAWLRHYVNAAQRRNEAALLRRGKPLPHLRYRRREVRLAYAIAVVVVGLLLAAWAAV